jgi:asparagine synthase (glutamine-hydrolysing)
MCGINGFNFFDKTQAELMNKAIKHRGPDDEGVFADANVTLGHVRLAILDLSKAGAQPMTYKHGDKSAIIVFNGEIYNFIELREELQKKGYVFNSRTDTEVILASYFEWGFDCVSHFNGMWAFAIYDPNAMILFCSRDRLGVKPLYYFYDGKKFIFSSELKGILAHKSLLLNNKASINQDALSFYFTLGYIPAPFSIYNNTFKLEARQNLIFYLKSCKTKKWYYYRIPKYAPIHNSKKLIEEGRKLLKDAVRLRMIADVPVGSFLSGGIDSTTVVGTINELEDIGNLHTFSIGFEGKYDETPFVNIAKDCFGTIHHHDYFKQNDFEELVDTYANTYDEPFADFSGFPTLKLCKMTRKYVTVALTGDGGDEIFGGYTQHINGSRMDLLWKTPLLLRSIFSRILFQIDIGDSTSLHQLRDNFNASLFDPTFFYSKASMDGLPLPKVYKDWTVSKLKLCMEFGVINFADIIRLYDLMFNTLPDNYLVKVDRASMAYALEVRSPFLDYRFAEFSQHIPTEWKVDLFRSKKLMREIAKGIIPDEILHRPKQGFTPPLVEWISNQKYELFLGQSSEYLKGINPELYQFFKENVVSKKGKRFDLHRIRLFIFGKWFERWIQNTCT